MSCCICQKAKTTLTCGICKEDLCKSCTQFLEHDSFSFLNKIPEDLKHTAYCGTCFNEKVSAELEKYNQILQRARDISVFEKSQSKETRLLKRKEKEYKIVDCPDREEAVLRFAFWAAQDGFNAVIDVNLASKKIKMDGYQTTVWSGTAMPINVSDRMLVKDRSIWSNPN